MTPNSIKFFVGLVGVALSLAQVSCLQKENGGAPTPQIDIAVHNGSAHDLDWVSVEWDGPHVPGGIMSKGKTSTALAANYPKSNTATLSFVDATSREKHEINIPLSSFQKLDPASVNKLEFIINSYTEAEVHVNGAILP